MFGPISGGHFNPVVSFVDAGFGGLKWSDAAAYLPFQILGCIGGAILANVMFSEAAISISTKHRASGPHWLSEVVATMGLILVIFALARSGRSHLAPAAVGAYIGAAYFFTSSPASPTRPSPSGACSPTPSPASLRLRSRASSPPRSSGVCWLSG